jgi:electron transfer flavoprotein alpha subunit
MAQTGVLVIGELTDGQLSLTSKEILAAGKPMADQLGQPMAVALLGADVGGAPVEAFSCGADVAYTVTDPLLDEYQADLVLSALDAICRESEPEVLLMGRTAMGRDVAPRLAARLGVGLAQDCLEVCIAPGTTELRANRPVYGGNAMATVSCSSSPQFATVRPKAYEPPDPDPSRTGEVRRVQVALDASMAKSKVVGVVREEAEGIKLEDARIVVAGGRGLGGPEPFADLEELAKVLGAGIGASRAAVDSGWVPASWQIGLTGKTITPDLYITVAISGASQHIAGCSGAKVIVAINKDAEANIFKEARYGVIGDWKKVLTAFTETVRELVKS